MAEPPLIPGHWCYSAPSWGNALLPRYYGVTHSHLPDLVTVRENFRVCNTGTMHCWDVITERFS